MVGLELGADDYVVKPFGFRELVAASAPSPAPAHRRIGRGTPAAGAAGADRRQRRVLVDGTEVVLTAKEFDLLALLAEDPGGG